MATVQRVGAPPTAAQRKYLKDRIEEIKRAANGQRWSLSSNDKKKNEPRAIVAARKRIEVYVKKQAKLNELEIKRLKLDKDHVESAEAKAKQALLFGTAEQALLAVAEFAKQYPFVNE